jgi:type IV pilus assembly protein PilA
MSDSDDLSPFGSTVPRPVDPPIPAPTSTAPGPVGGPEQSAVLPSMPPPPAQTEPADIDEPSMNREQTEEGSSPVAVLSPPQPHHELGNDWQFGAGKGPSMPVSLPGSRKSIALVLVVVLVAAAGAYFFLNRSSSPGGTALALSLSPGQTYRYHLDMSFDGSVKVAGQAAPVSMQFGEDFTWKVESVDASGLATVTMTVESITSTVNGQSASAGEPMTIQVKVAKDGRILTAGNLALTGGSSASEGFPGTDQFLPLLPDHPVKPGDAWDKTFDQDFPFGNGKIHYVAHNSYLRNEDVGGVQAAVIGGTVKVPLDLTIDPNEISKALDTPADPTIPKGAKVLFTGTMDLTQTAWLDLAKHTLLKGSLTGAMDMTIQLKGIPAPAEIPDGTIGLIGNVTLRIQATDAAPAQPPATTNAADRAAQSNLRNALAASRTYFTDRDSYAGLSPKVLEEIEPALTYNTASRAKKGEVSIRGISKNIALLVIKSDSGRTFCLVDDVSGTGVVYGTQDAKKAAGCTGGW